jgi:CheY-like chemotaxis protein
VDKPVVLLADDNEATCTLIKAVLQGEFTVELASDGSETIEKLKSRQYAAVLLDLLMPTSDGYAVLEHVAQHRPELMSRILVVTASVMRREMQRLEKYPIHGVVAKPFDVDELLAAVRRCSRAEGGPNISGILISGGMILLLADLLR